MLLRGAARGIRATRPPRAALSKVRHTEFFALNKFSITEPNKRKLNKRSWLFKVHNFCHGGHCDYTPRAPKKPSYTTGVISLPNNTIFATILQNKLESVPAFSRQTPPASTVARSAVWCAWQWLLATPMYNKLCAICAPNDPTASLNDISWWEID